MKKYLYYLFIVCFCLFSFNTSATTTISTTTITSPSTWTVIGSPYLITGDVFVKDTSFKIYPGVVLVFKGGSLNFNNSSFELSSTTINVLTPATRNYLINVSSSSVSGRGLLMDNNLRGFIGATSSVVRVIGLKTVNKNLLFYSEMFRMTNSKLYLEDSYIQNWQTFVMKNLSNSFFYIKNNYFYNNFEVLYDPGNNGYSEFTHNTFEKNAYPFGLQDHKGFANYNDFINNRHAITISSDIHRYDFKNNYYGNTSGPLVYNVNAFTDYNLFDNKIKGNVNYLPYLIKPFKDSTICCSNIVFFPGLMGNRLYSKGILTENQLWEPNRNGDVKKLFLDTNGKSVTRVYTRDMIGKTNLTSGSYLDESLYNGFERYLKGLKNDNQINDYSIVPYDWRYSPDTLIVDGVNLENVSFDIISNLISVASSSKTKKINIIAHSNGGLLTKYILTQLSKQNRSDIIDKVILVAVPEYGTPQAITSLLYGHSQSILKGLILKSSIAKKLGDNMPASYMLLPSTKYLTANYIFGVTDLEDFLSKNGINKELYDKAKKLRLTIDNFNYGNFDIYQIIGSGLLTVNGVELSNNKYIPSYSNDGDGTVQAATTIRTGKLSILNLNKTSFNHINIMNWSRVHDQISSILDGSYKAISDSINNLTTSNFIKVQTTNKNFILKTEVDFIKEANTNLLSISTSTNSIISEHVNGYDILESDANSLILESKSNNNVDINIKGSFYSNVFISNKDILIGNNSSLKVGQTIEKAMTIYPDNSTTSLNVDDVIKNITESDIDPLLKTRYLYRINYIKDKKDIPYLISSISRVKTAIQNIDSFSYNKSIYERYKKPRVDYVFILNYLYILSKIYK